MKTTKLFSIIALALFVSCSACSKESVHIGENNQTVKNLPGAIYFQFAGKYGYIRFGENKFVEAYAMKSDFGKIDISQNGKNILLVTTKGISGTDHQRIVYRELSPSIAYTTLSDNNNIFSFKYQWRNIGIGSGTQCYISPNEKFIAINAESSGNHPITIVRAGEDETVESFRDANVSLRNHKIIGWTADNSLIVNVDGSIFKINEAGNWEPNGLLKIPSLHATINPQGTKVVFRAEKHLFMCNTDGSDVRQITQSKTIESLTEDGERLPVFSPDGRYIAFSTKAIGAAASWENPIDGSVVGTGSHYGYLAIIPADGKLYDMDSKNSGVIFPVNAKNKLIAVDGESFWK